MKLRERGALRFPRPCLSRYDASDAMDALAWRPRVTFDAVLRALESAEPGGRAAADGDGARGAPLDEAASLDIVLRGAY